MPKTILNISIKMVELKKVNSKYILKSTLTPRLARKELQKEFMSGGLTKSHSMSSLNDSESDARGDGKPQNHFNNYLTVHSFPSQLNLPTITTQSFDDLLPPVEGPQGLRPRHTGSTTIPVDGQAPSEHNKHHLPHPHFPTPWTTMTPQEIAMWIDTRSRYIFPLAFVIYNAIYWTYVYVF